MKLKKNCFRLMTTKMKTLMMTMICLTISMMDEDDDLEDLDDFEDEDDEE